ncbi:MAG: baseplate J/gp47 family protein [Candidatus Heimdallarchaeaceae archaeon]
MAIITDNGVNIDTIEEAVKNNTASYSEKTGDVDVSPSSASGELIAITSEMDVRNQQNVADAFTQNTITDATELNLDNLALVKNQERKENQSSIVFVKFEGVNTTVVPKDTILICSDNDEEFLTDFAVTIASGEAFVSATSVNIGVICPAETISLKTAITDITSATNQTDAEVGFDSESDSALRTRLQFIGSPFTNNLKEGLFLALTGLQNTTKVAILDNNTDSTIDGVPARYFSPVVQGGNQAEIARIIYRYMGVGNPSFGDISQTIISDIDSSISYVVSYNIPTELLTVVAATITTDSSFNSDTGFDEIRDNIVAYFGSLKIGEDAIIQKVEAVCFIQGVTAVDILLNASAVSLNSTFKELFVTNLSNVTAS